MHSASFDIDSGAGGGRDGGDVLVAIAALVTEGRIPAGGCGGAKGKSPKGRGFYEGPHCASAAAPQPTPPAHNCNPTDDLCRKYEAVKSEVLNLWRRGIPLCVEVTLVTTCPCQDECNVNGVAEETSSKHLLLEQWYFSVTQNRLSDISSPFNLNQLINAVRSQLYFSQISAWLSSQDTAHPTISTKNLKYRLTVPGETFEQSKFTKAASKHDFPSTDLGNGLTLNVSLLSLPRMSKPPKFTCQKCEPSAEPTVSVMTKDVEEKWMLDDRMHTSCTLKGKHRCEDLDEFEPKKERKFSKGLHQRVAGCCGREAAAYSQPSTSKVFPNTHKPDTLSSNTDPLKLDIKLSTDAIQAAMSALKKDDLRSNKSNEGAGSGCSGSDVLNVILRSCRLQQEDVKCDVKCVQKLGELGSSILSGCAKALQSVSDINSDKNAKSDIFNVKNKNNIYVDSDCDSHRPIPNKRPIHHQQHHKMRDISNTTYNPRARQKITFEEDNDAENGKGTKTKEDDRSGIEIPSPFEQAKFRQSLDSAASMVFHSRTGLPLTSSPAPVRRGKSCFDFDSSINSVSAIKSALFSASFSTDDDSESDGSIVSPCSPETYIYPKKQPSPVKHYRRGHSANLLGSFEESVLNGRLEPVSTVHGFKAELGASGTFVPPHLVLPVTVFFYTLGDNDKVSSPYLGHINLGRKGYNVPKTGTVQVTLFNPLGTVVKMFVIMYDLSDMPPNSQTFIRQRTLYMPASCQDKNLEWGPKWLRYLIHLRFMSSKSGRIYLHSDIRMIIFRKSDLDTATAHGIDMCYELRSFTHMPANPKYSPRK